MFLKSNVAKLFLSYHVSSCCVLDSAFVTFVDFTHIHWRLVADEAQVGRQAHAEFLVQESALHGKESELGNHHTIATTVNSGVSL